MTWNELAVRFPELVQWVVATYGPLPEGDITKADYERYTAPPATDEHD